MAVLSVSYIVASFAANSFIFFFNDTATTEIYTLSLHDALPISAKTNSARNPTTMVGVLSFHFVLSGRSEEHTSELQSQSNIVCRLLLEKKNEAQEFRFVRLQQARNGLLDGRH